MKALISLNLDRKRVLVRCDFNVPLGERGQILDDFRIKESLPTINYLRQKKAKIILMSHLGDPLKEIPNSKRQIPACPAGRPNKSQTLNFQKYSLKPVAERLKKLLKIRVKLLNDCVGEKVKLEIEKMNPGEIVLLENLRFHAGEKENNDDFAKALAGLGDYYVNDAFGACHRRHASIALVPKYLPSAAGLLLEKEIKVLTNLLKFSKKPLVVVIGGKKVETKAKLINKISRIARFVLVGGLVACELKEKNINFPNSRKIILPGGEINAVCAFDIGKEALRLFGEKIKTAKTVLWTGPLGKVEKKEFQKGSLQIAKDIIKSRAFSVVGGGETIWFLEKNRLINKFSHVSTGGGAMLAYLAGEKLPGLEALELKQEKCVPSRTHKLAGGREEIRKEKGIL